MQVDEYRAAFDAIAWSDRDNILSEVDVELARQDEKWGTQRHLTQAEEARYMFASFAEGYKRVNDRAAKDGTLDWTGILLEEVYEALAEEDQAKLRAELVQVAAVAVQWVQAIDDGRSL